MVIWEPRCPWGSRCALCCATVLRSRCACWPWAGAGLDSGPDAGTECRGFAPRGLRRDDHGGQRNVAMPPRRGARAAFRAVERAGIDRHCAHRLSAHLSLRAQFAGESLLPPHILAARAKGLGEARILFWHVVPSVPPIARRGRSFGQHGGRRGHSGRSVVRLGGRGTTGLAGGSGPGSAAAGEYHDSGDAGNLAGQFRRRCNRSYVPQAGGMKLGRKLSCGFGARAWAVIAANWLAPGICEAVSRGNRCAAFSRALAGNR